MLKRLNMQILRYRMLNVLRHSLSTTTKANVETTEGNKLVSEDANKFIPDVKYSNEEKEKILKIINNSKIDDLLSYNISKMRANKLLSWLKHNGALTDLNDILHIEGFGSKYIIKFYQSLLNEETADVRKYQKVLKLSKSFITPKIDIKQRLNTKSCVAVRIGINNVAWARLELPSASAERPSILTHWQQHDVVDKKLHLSDLVQRCLYVNHLIPTSDCYILENPPTAQATNKPSSLDQKNVSIQKAQITAMLGFALALRNQLNEDKIHSDDIKMSSTPTNVFYMRRLLPARLFNYLVGAERVSSEKIVIDMMRTYYNIDECFVKEGSDTLTIRSNVQFSQELREMFSLASPSNRDLLSQALLLNLAFVRLILFEEEQSIATVTGLNRKTG
uniref:Transcription elongation factor, mitochondrial n=1 Tax=Glossina brevipalpis TaxID=37001 RepID=A0A1A9WD82_9MUSC